MSLNQFIRIAGIVRESVVEGPGLRMTVFFQGCSHRCPGCHNPQTWNFEAGKSITVAEILNLFSRNPLLQGITLSGGDPFYQAAAAVRLAEEVHKLRKDVWTYTGFTWEELFKIGDQDQMRLLQASDVLIDGPFLSGLKNEGLVFAGSANQRLIDVKSSLAQKAIIEWKLN